MAGLTWRTVKEKWNLLIQCSLTEVHREEAGGFEKKEMLSVYI